MNLCALCLSAPLREAKTTTRETTGSGAAADASSIWYNTANGWRCKAAARRTPQEWNLTQRRGEAESAERKIETMTENEITGDILDAAIKIHRKFGPGMLESVYERLLEAELLKRGHSVERQKSVSFEYEGMTLEDAFRVDLLVDERIVVELKAVEKMNPLFLKQVKTYLVAMNLPLGVLVNFGMEKLVDGYVRVVNGFDESSALSTS